MSFVKEIKYLLGIDNRFDDFLHNVAREPEKITKTEDGFIEYKKILLRVNEDSGIPWADMIRDAHPDDAEKIIENINKDPVERMLEIANETQTPVIRRDISGKYKYPDSLTECEIGSFDFIVNPGDDLEETKKRFLKEQYDVGNKKNKEIENHQQGLNKSKLATLRKKLTPNARTLMMTGAFVGGMFFATEASAKADGGKIVTATNVPQTDQNSMYYLHMTRPMTMGQLQAKIFKENGGDIYDGSLKAVILPGENDNSGVICADEDGQVLGAFVDIKAYSEYSGKDMQKILYNWGFEASGRHDIEGYSAVATAIRKGFLIGTQYSASTLSEITKTLDKKGYDLKLSEDIETSAKTLKIFKNNQLVGLMGNNYGSTDNMWLRTEDQNLQKIMEKFNTNKRNDFSKLYEELQKDSGGATYQMQPTQKQY